MCVFNRENFFFSFQRSVNIEKVPRDDRVKKTMLRSF